LKGRHKVIHTVEAFGSTVQALFPITIHYIPTSVKWQVALYTLWFG